MRSGCGLEFCFFFVERRCFAFVAQVIKHAPRSISCRRAQTDIPELDCNRIAIIVAQPEATVLFKPNEQAVLRRTVQVFDMHHLAAIG